MRFAFCNEGFTDRTWPAVCAAIAEAGYDGVEIAPFTLAESVQAVSPHAREELRRAAHDAGLEVVGLHWLLVKPEGLHISHPDAAVRARTRDYLRHLADFCADLGGKVMVFGSPKQRGGTAGASPELFRAVAPTLEERNVTLCFEPLGRGDTDFINTAGAARKLVEEVASPRFRLILDAKAMCDEGEPAGIIRQHADLLAHVHANDANLEAPGFGATDFRPILAALREVGYGGYVSVEPFRFPMDTGEIARRARQYLAQCLPA